MTLGSFLSHLSGDEGFVLGVIVGLIFLSHLSGDEADFTEVVKYMAFLSHLSGDEAYQYHGCL